MTQYCPGTGNPLAKLMIIEEAPDRNEEREGQLLIGPPGHLLNEMLGKAGTSRSEVYITSVLKYRPPNDNIKQLNECGTTLAKQVTQLRQEIETIKPNAILCLTSANGKSSYRNLSLETLTGKSGITNYRGSILEFKDHVTPKVIPTLHPANLLPGRDYVSYSARAYVQLDVNRAIEESRDPRFNPPNRLLQIIRRAGELVSFLHSYDNKLPCAVDIETYEGIPVCISLAFVSSHAISIPLLKSTGLIQETDLIECWKLLAKFLAQGNIIGQNFKFDEQKLYHTSRLRIGKLVGDTMFLQHCLNPEFPKGLGFITSIYTKEPYYKDEGKTWNPKKDSIDKLLYYNCKDAATTIEAHQNMMIECKTKGLESFYEDYLLKLHPIYLGIEQRGIRVDYNQRQKLKEKYTGLLEESQEALNSLCGKAINTNSPKQIRSLLFEKFKLPEREKVDEESLVALYANNSKSELQRRVIDHIINIRRYRKTLGTYINAQVDYDGRMRTSYQICGTETGRRSTTILKPPIRPERIGTSLLTWTKHGDIGSDIRSFLIPDEGYEFLELDLSQAEARIALLYADDEESLHLMDTIDFHRWTASKCFGIEEKLVSQDQRFIGKSTRYLRQYFGSKRRLMQTINTDSRRFHIGCSKSDEYRCDGKHVSLSEWKCGEILNTFDRFTPKLQQVFHRAVREQLEANRTFENCYGRKRTFFERFDDELLRSAFAHSCSSVVADHIGRSLILLQEQLPSFQVQIEFHDAIFGQCLKSEVEKSAKVIKEILERPIDFTKGSIPRRPYVIPAECVWSPNNYQDLRKVKF